ncbi:MAG: hypothetical protein K0S01_3720 [Herbinix sp.]|jgi:hypothetical protein|nr:hypothetical protein [Herbinix sp.]
MKLENEQKLSEACEHALDIIIKNYYDGIETMDDMGFSAAFEEKMQRLIRVQKKLYYHLINSVGKRIAIIIITISSFFVVANAEAIYRLIINFTITDRVTDSRVLFDTDEDMTYPTSIEEVRIPVYSSEGFKEIDRLIVEEGLVKVTYQNNLGEEYIYYQMVLDTSQIINTEGVVTEEFEINGMKVLYCKNLSDSIATWSDGVYGYKIVGEITKEEVVKIIENK